MIILANIKVLYDGKSGASASVHRTVDLWIDGDRIHSLVPSGRPLPTGDAVSVVDCSSYTVAPGLVDCHGHVVHLGLSDEDEVRINGANQLLYVEKILHTSLVDGGVTTIRDVGGATHAMKKMVDDGLVIGPRLVIAICMLSTTGGHADFRGHDRCHSSISRLWPEGPGRPSSIVDGPWECRKRVREIAACGADLIKLCTSPGVASPSDQLENQDFTPEEVSAICSEAAARGLRVAAHAHSRAGIELAIKNGVSDLQHISFMDERLVDMAAKHGCTVTPTSWVLQTLSDSDGLSPFVREKAKRVAEVHAKAVQYARAGGLKILGGTDPVLPGMHGRNYVEMSALMNDGLTNLEAWYAMTGLAAREVGLSDTGAIEPGFRADLLICRDDVIANPRLFGRDTLVEVIKEGVGHRGGLSALPQRRFADNARALWPADSQPTSA
ncbi:MAG TPA: amidohydrolase family protein [Polyangia bacterium]|jgi:imidazolonepropionase-like amidohydrolase